MSQFTKSELDLMSRALEKAIVALPGKPRGDIQTSDLAEGIIQAAATGVRGENELAQLALGHVLNGNETRARTLVE
jgi:hypothetical protein